jgi:TolA-binding protein
MKKNLLILLFLTQLFVFSAAQTTIYHTDKDVVFREAIDQFQKEKYNTAQKLFEQAYEGYPDNSELKSLSQFYIAQCAVRLFNADAEFLTTKFIADNPNSARVNEAWFSLGGYFYTLKNGRPASIPMTR